MELLGMFLCFLSFFRTYKDLYTNDEIRFTDLLGLMDETTYTVEITEMPEELYPSYYMVKMGDNALLVTGIDDELGKLERKGHVKVRGKLYSFTEEEEEIRESARDYYSENGYFADDFIVKGRAAGHYLKCSKVGFLTFVGALRGDHPLGLVFGLTILLINSLIMCSEGTWLMIRHFHPACGSVRLKPREIDAQADLPESEWLERVGLYFTPEILIGTNRGMAAVRYDDIERAYTRKRNHIDWFGGPGMSKVGMNRVTAGEILAKNLIWAASDSSEYSTYQLMVVCKNHRKVKMCEVTYFDPAILDRLRERCGPEVKVDEINRI